MISGVVGATRNSVQYRKMEQLLCIYQLDIDYFFFYSQYNLPLCYYVVLFLVFSVYITPG